MTPDYRDEFLKQLEQWHLHIQEQYGSPIPFDRTDFLAILFESEKVDARTEGLELFLDVTDPANWPDSEQIYLCWLQIARSQAQLEYDQNIPFTMPPTSFGLSVSDGFDMETCQFTQ